MLKKIVLLFSCLLLVSCSLGLVDPIFEEEFAASINKSNNTDSNNTGGSSSEDDSTQSEEEQLLAEYNRASFLDYVSDREGEATVSVKLGSGWAAKTYNIDGTGTLDSTGEVFTITVPNIGAATYQFYKLVSYDDDRTAYYKRIDKNINITGVYSIVSSLIKPMLEDILTDFYGLDFSDSEQQKLYVYENDASDPNGNNLVFDNWCEYLDMYLEKNN